MPQYRYLVQDDKGKRRSGTANAASENELHQQLREQGLYLLSCDEIIAARRKQLKLNVLSDFCRQLGTLLGAGITLIRALSIISQGESVRPKDRAAFEELMAKIRRGTPLSDAMEEMSGVFPPLMIHMIRSAENSGNMDKTALKLADLYDKEYRTRRKVASAMTYPKLLTVMVIGVILLLSYFIMPRLQELFSGMEELPTATTILMGVSHLITDQWLWLLAGIALIYALVRLLMTMESVRIGWHRILLHLPLIGKLQKIICTSRFARSLSSLYSAGIPILSALQIARKTAGNDYIDSQFGLVISCVRAGNNLSDALEKVDGFTHKLCDSVRVGEETGSLDSMLLSTADALEYDSDIATAKLVSYVEPVMLLIMGLIVAFMLLGVFQAIYGSYDAILAM